MAASPQAKAAAIGMSSGPGNQKTSRSVSWRGINEFWPVRNRHRGFLLLHQRSVDEIVPKLSAVELEQVIKLVGRSPRVYPPGTLDALKRRRTSTSARDNGTSDLATKEPAPSHGARDHSPQSIIGNGSPQTAVAKIGPKPQLPQSGRFDEPVTAEYAER